MVRRDGMQAFRGRALLGWVLLGLAFCSVGIEALLGTHVAVSKFAVVIGPVGLALILADMVPRA